MQFEILKYKSVTSTNDVAIDLIKKKQRISGCVYAETQTKGRGTRGKKWISDKGNLFISLFFPLEKKYPPFNEFSIINAVIISNTIKKFCNQKKITLKFPNDIFLNNRKICGLLQELITLEEREFLIIGVGLNVVSNPNINNKYQTTNMFLETNKKISINETIKSIVSSYESFFINLDFYNYKSYKEKVELMSLK